APSLSERSTSTSWSMSRSDTRPSPSQAGHIPSAWLKLNAEEVPAYGLPSLLKMIRSMAYASVAVPTVERELAAMVPKTSDDLPEPETPVKAVRRRFGDVE